MGRALFAVALLGLLALAACEQGVTGSATAPETEKLPGTDAAASDGPDSDVGLEARKHTKTHKKKGTDKHTQHKYADKHKPDADAKHQPPKYPSPEGEAPYYPPPGPDNAYPAPGDSWKWWRKHDADREPFLYKQGPGGDREPWGEYAPPREGYGPKDDYGYGEERPDYYAPHYGQDDRPYSHYRPDPSPPKGCKNKLPPACQTFAASSLASTDHYSGSYHYPAPPSTPKPHTPTCASTGAVYAWSPTCAAVTPVNGQCPGAALCQPGNGAAESVATCTASGWVVTNQCSPMGCSGQPTPAPKNATFASCSVPGFINQVCPATCGGGLTSTVQAVCRPAGWSVSGCCVPANMTLYNLGTIDLQKGWTVRDNFVTTVSVGNFDQAVVDVPGIGRVWRMSNANVTGGFANQPNTYSSCEVAGETGSFLWNDRGPDGSAPCGGVCNSVTPPLPAAPGINKHFYWSARFKSATGATQPGLRISLPVMSRQSTWRMTNLAIVDTGFGFDLVVNEATAQNGAAIFPTPPPIASNLTYTDWYTLATKITFVDGINNSSGLLTGNDIAEVFLDGNLIYTGSTWEALYYTSGGGAPFPRLQAVDSLLFRAGGLGTAAPGTFGFGFYFNDIVVSNSPPV